MEGTRPRARPPEDRDSKGRPAPHLRCTRGHERGSRGETPGRDGAGTGGTERAGLTSQARRGPRTLPRGRRARAATDRYREGLRRQRAEPGAVAEERRGRERREPTEQGRGGRGEALPATPRGLERAPQDPAPPPPERPPPAGCTLRPPRAVRAARPRLGLGGARSHLGGAVPAAAATGFPSP